MALFGILIATLIALLMIVFFNPFFSGKTDPAPLEPKKIENSAESAVDKATEKKELENKQIETIDVR